MNALQILQSWGFPRGVDNTRIKPWVLYDTQTAAAGTLEYNFFQTNPSDIFDRNRQLPLSGDETMLVEKLRLTVETSGIDLSANYTEVFCRSYLEISVNDTQKIKLPLWEVFNGVLVSKIGANSINTSPVVVKRQKVLQYPIILFKRANVSFKVVLSSNAATALNARKVKLELVGVKLDFVAPNDLDPVANNKYELLSTTLYNTQTIVGGANTYSLFSDRTTSHNNINKVFPLSDSELFSIEAIEILNFGLTASDNGGSLFAETQQNVLRINVNQTEFYFGSNTYQNSLLFRGTAAFTDAGAVSTTFTQNQYFTTAPEVFGLVRQGVPVMIPSNSQVEITLQQPATNCTNFVMVMLKGTLERRIS